MLGQRFDCSATTGYLTYMASRQRFATFNDLTRYYGIADQDWPYIYTLLYRHLDDIIIHCRQRNMPCLPVLAVSRKNRKDGQMPPRQIKRLSQNMLLAGYIHVGTMERILQHQYTSFTWAQTQPMPPDNDMRIDPRLDIPMPIYPPSSPLGKKAYMHNEEHRPTITAKQPEIIDG